MSAPSSSLEPQIAHVRPPVFGFAGSLMDARRAF